MAQNYYLNKISVIALILAQSLTVSAFSAPSRMAHSAPAKEESGDNNYETILYEDFSKWTEGTEDEPDGTMYPLDYFTTYDNTIPSDMFLTPGDYNGVGCYQAGGCIALNYPGMGGYLNFPSKEMSGKLILTARVKALGEASTLFSINILTGDPSFPQSVENDGGMAGMMTITSEDGWVEINREIINSYTDPCWLQINAMMYNAKGIVVDYVKIERDLNYLTAPVLTASSHFTNDGFTASWQNDPKAESYLVSLYEKVPVGTTDYMAYEDFENATLDEMTGQIALNNGWSGTFGFSFDGNIATDTDTPDDVFEGHQSIRLHNNDRLTFFLDNTLVKDLTMAFMTNASEDNRQNVSLRVIPYTKYNPGDQDYAFYWMMRASRLDEGWNWIQMSEFFEDFGGGFTRVDLVPEGLKSGEYMIIDNLCALTEPLTETSCIVEDAETQENQLAFSELDMTGNTYFFTVKAKNSSCTSMPSEETYAIGVGAPVVLEATELDKRGAFTANWEPAVNATSYTVNCYEARKITETIPDYPVFTEDFSKAEGGENGSYIFLENVDYVQLDSFSDNEGWAGSGTLVGDGMVGCYMMEASGQLLPFEMVSPAINLSKDGGNFKVTVDFQIQEEGEILIIQCDNSNYIGIQGAQPGELTHATVELTSGTEESRLLIYTFNSTPFMLDKVVVSQNYNVGDEILTKIDFKEVNDGSESSARFTGLERKDYITYKYDIVSHRDFYGRLFNSEKSEQMTVDLYESIVKDITTDQSGDRKFFDLQGRAIEGSPEAGVYVVVEGGKAHKVIVK